MKKGIYRAGCSIVYTSIAFRIDAAIVATIILSPTIKPKSSRQFHRPTLYKSNDFAYSNNGCTALQFITHRLASLNINKE